MKPVRITVVHRALHENLFAAHDTQETDVKGSPCPYFETGQSFEAHDTSMPEGFCPVAWGMLFADIRMIRMGANPPWMTHAGQTITCCRDGLRPVSFLVERIGETT